MVMGLVSIVDFIWKKSTFGANHARRKVLVIIPVDGSPTDRRNAPQEERMHMPLPPRSVSTTEGLRVTASAFYLPEESNPDESQFMFGYLIHLANEGTQTAKLLSRHWIIIDAEGEKREVKGLGVVGEHPTIEPGAEYKYTSAVPLPTPWGTMEGSYEMERPDGTTFQAKIARFYLAMPLAAPASASSNA